LSASPDAERCLGARHRAGSGGGEAPVFGRPRPFVVLVVAEATLNLQGVPVRDGQLDECFDVERL
jgi:hypothetical protein